MTEDASRADLKAAEDETIFMNDIILMGSVAQDASMDKGMKKSKIYSILKHVLAEMEEDPEDPAEEEEPFAVV